MSEAMFVAIKGPDDGGDLAKIVSLLGRNIPESWRGLPLTVEKHEQGERRTYGVKPSGSLKLTGGKLIEVAIF